MGASNWGLYRSFDTNSVTMLAVCRAFFFQAAVPGSCSLSFISLRCQVLTFTLPLAAAWGTCEGVFASSDVLPLPLHPHWLITPQKATAFGGYDALQKSTLSPTS